MINETEIEKKELNSTKILIYQNIVLGNQAAS